MEDWFDIVQVKSYIYLIREKLDLIDDRFYTEYTNLYLILGTHTAVLFDTGSGLKKLKPYIDNLIGTRELIVINSHNHFDHVGGNREFPSVYIHRFDLKRLTKPIDVSFLKGSSSEYAKNFANNNYLVECNQEHHLLIGEEKFDLGEIRIEVITTPGHTPGSICLLTDKGDLFTGDTVHEGAVYLPTDDEYQNYRHSLVKLKALLEAHPHLILYPAHENYSLNGKIILELLQLLDNLDMYREEANYDDFLEAYFFVHNKFRIIFPENYKFS